jgi:hypothetical protein
VQFRFQSCARTVACYFVLSFLMSPALRGADDDSRPDATSDPEAKILAALDRHGEWKFLDVPIREVIETLSAKLNIDIVLDQRSLDDFGIGANAPITRVSSGISNRSFLRLLLQELELTYVVKDQALWITTVEYAESMLLTKVYPVGDLIHDVDEETGPGFDYDSLIAVVTNTVAPDSWDKVGGPSAIDGIYGSLVVSTTTDVHEQITSLLDTYREIVAKDKEGQTGAGPYFAESPGNATVRTRLNLPLTAKHIDVPLPDVLDHIAAELKLPIVIDVKALDDFGIDTSAPVTANFNAVPLQIALRRMLHELELTFTVRDEVLMVTTPEQAERQLQFALYPVRDLVSYGEVDDPDTYDWDSLIQIIESTVAPDTWSTVGGPGDIQVLMPTATLVIPQTEDVHEQITGLLGKLRTAKKEEAKYLGKLETNAADKLSTQAYPIGPVDTKPEEVLELVLRTFRPNDLPEGAFIQTLGRSIVVRHDHSTHRRIGRLLFEVGVTMPIAGGSTGPPPNPQGGGGGGFF